MTDEEHDATLAAGVVTIEDLRGRLMAANLDKRTGEVMFSCPIKKVGRVRRIVQVTRAQARQFAHDLLKLVGEHDQ